MEDRTKVLEQRLDHMNSEIQHLHDSLEARGVNSRRVTDSLRGEVFQVPVDAEHKAKMLPICNCSVPHMRAFHASWLGFFSTFFSTFAPAPLAATLKKPSTLGLTRQQLQYGNLASVTSNIVCRFLMGIVCDKLGARRGLAFVLLITCPFIIGIAFVQDAAGFIICRGGIGIGLASFVACQVWCTQQFSKSIVGVANATAGGWGNLGGGITNLLMPFVFLAFMSATGDDDDLSWRLCFIVPLALHLFSAFFALSGRDLPDGNFSELEMSGAKQKSNAGLVAKIGVSNINGWILTITYGFCFGVELTMTNVASQYFYEYFGTSQLLSGMIASIFGLVNIFARSLGGITSDACAKRYGMRGRIWALWFFQTLEGIMCIIMGALTLKYTAPDLFGPDITGWVELSGDNQEAPFGGKWVPFNGTCFSKPIKHCGHLAVDVTDAMRNCGLSPLITGSKVVLAEPLSPLGDADDCVANSGMIGLVIFVMFLFSVSVQMAEGLTYGIVPFVSRPALGVISGMVGAGGNAGSLVTNSIFFLSDSVRTDQGLLDMGVCIVAVTLLCFLVYFPEHGSMLTPAGVPSCYDPQLIKPPADYRGADSMDYSNASMLADKGADKGEVNVVSTTVKTQNVVQESRA